MIIRCEECNHKLVGDEVEYLYNEKSYCYNCYNMIKAADSEDKEKDKDKKNKKNRTISSKISKFGKGFKIPDDKKK
jgi:hypothetical protein